jgi:hypothetical protein
VPNTTVFSYNDSTLPISSLISRRSGCTKIIRVNFKKTSISSTRKECIKNKILIILILFITLLRININIVEQQVIQDIGSKSSLITFSRLCKIFWRYINTLIMTRIIMLKVARVTTTIYTMINNTIIMSICFCCSLS